MSLLNTVDPDGLLEYSVVYTDRALNHMSIKFQHVMRDIFVILKKVYSASTVVVVPGSGTFAMEAVVRQFATDKKCLVIRNGWFSFRWSQIFDAGKIPSSSIVLKARPVSNNENAAFIPPERSTVVETIKKEKPEVVFAPHVETASGIIIPDDYIKSVADAIHSVGGIFVLDCIASGSIWIDMQAIGVDVLISAPQKGWSGSPCCGLVMMNDNACHIMESTTSSSFACDLAKWHQIMQAYENGGHAYHATMPTDSLAIFRDMLNEIESFGFDSAFRKQLELGTAIRKLLEENGFASVAAEGFKAPGVVVCYTDDNQIVKKFLDKGIQIAAGVPLKCDEPENFQTFRVGLFGLDKLKDVDGTVTRFEAVLKQIY
jgi:aspartate aminotransferase-like enzyme